MKWTLVALACWAALTPPAWASDRPGILDLMAIRDLGTSSGGLALSPDGQWLATVEIAVTADHADARYRVIVLPTRDGLATPRIIGDGGRAILFDADGRRTGHRADRVVRWSPDSRRVAFIAEREGRAELWVSDLGGASRAVARPDGDVRDFRWLSAREVLIDVATPRSILDANAARDLSMGFRVDESFDAGFSLHRLPDIAEGRRWLVANVRNRELRNASEEEINRREPWIARIGPRDAGSDAYMPARSVFAQMGAATIRCEADACSGRLREAGAMGDGIWFTRGEGMAGGDFALYRWRPLTGEVIRLRLEDERLLGCSAADEMIFCLRETPTAPRHVVAISAENGALNVVYDPNPQWGRLSFPHIERIAFRDGEGYESYAHLVFPYDYEPGRAYPLVIVQYRSRGFLRGGTGGEYPIFPLAARGYFVMSVERPEAVDLGATLSRQEFEELMFVGDGEERIKLRSIDGLIDAVVRRGLVDPDRIAITGMSDGAETLFWALRERRFAAAVTSSPPMDLLNWQLSDASFRRSRAWAGLEPGPDGPGAWWRHNAAYFFAERITTPLLMNLPESEALMGMPLHARLTDAGAVVETYIYPGAYHAKWRPTQVLAAQERAMAWIDFWLTDRETPDPGDPERYGRWRAMRETATARP